MQIKKAGFLTKIVVLTMLIAATVGLLRLQGQITAAEAELEEKQMEKAERTQTIDELRDAIEQSGDPERQAGVARDELGLVAPGEKVIIFTD